MKNRTKKTRVDIRTGQGAKDNGTQENSSGAYSQKIEALRRSHPPEGIQHRSIARLARLTNRGLRVYRCFSYKASPLTCAGLSLF